VVDIVLSSDDLVVLGGPESVNVEVDFGPQGDRGSLIFVGNGDPDLVDIGQDPNIFDLYINLLTTDPNYLMIYQYVEALGTLQWQTLTKLIPNTYVKNDSVNFDVENASYIPIADIVDPSYVGNTDASNFSVQATFATSTGYPIVSSIKTEVIEATLTEPAKLKITFYAKEFDGTNWIDITGSRTVNLHISVV
jgi:hypothetical protein